MFKTAVFSGVQRAKLAEAPFEEEERKSRPSSLRKALGAGLGGAVGQIGASALAPLLVHRAPGLAAASLLGGGAAVGSGIGARLSGASLDEALLASAMAGAGGLVGNARQLSAHASDMLASLTQRPDLRHTADEHARLRARGTYGIDAALGGAMGAGGLSALKGLVDG